MGKKHSQTSNTAGVSRYGYIDPFSDPGDDSISLQRSKSVSSSGSDSSSVFVSSNPSTRRPSDSSSFNDVCFPVNPENEIISSSTAWPNVQVLQEYTDEIDRNEILLSNTEEVPRYSDTGTLSTREGDNEVNFQWPLVSNIERDDELRRKLNPSTGNNDDYAGHPFDPLKKRPSTSKLKSMSEDDEYLDDWSSLSTNNKQERLEKLRFTYFRDDLENTIHSSSLIGLLRGDTTWADLFCPEIYNGSTKTATGTVNTTSTAGNNDKLNNTIPIPNISVPNSSLHASSSPSAIPTLLQQQGNVTTPKNDLLNRTLESLSTPAQPKLTSPQSAAAATTSSATASTTATQIPTPLMSQSPIPEPTPFWLDVLNPSDDEMKLLARTFNIHPLTAEDILTGEIREKVELFKDYYFVCFSSFDVAEEHQKRKKKESEIWKEREKEKEREREKERGNWLFQLFKKNRKSSDYGSIKSSIRSSLSRSNLSKSTSSSRSTTTKKNILKSSRHKDELLPLNVYFVVFRYGVITFHFKPSPHPGNVRRRARLLKDYLTVTSDWIGYALIDDITDAYGPLIDGIQIEVNRIEDAILHLQTAYKSDIDDSDSDYSDSDSDSDSENKNVWVRMKRRNSNIIGERRSLLSKSSRTTKSSRSTRSSTSSTNTKVISWKRKGDLIRQIGDCRRRIMSLLRLLNTKADVIKIFSKRCNEQWEVAPRYEIGLYLGDIQDHVVTMVQSLNHFEKLLARCHSNYLAQINIEMTKVNNDMNDILGKITILGTIILPLNIVTGLWGMNCLVPGQDIDSLDWFYGIIVGMFMFSVCCYYYAKNVMHLM